jgi:hypothetical protein
MKDQEGRGKSMPLIAAAMVMTECIVNCGNGGGNRQEARRHACKHMRAVSPLQWITGQGPNRKLGIHEFTVLTFYSQLFGIGGFDPADYFRIYIK